ncbi:MAG: selenide, water dikinase SelD [Cetobacterium sp.]|uniref:selenide, water dikinase SelD n=1 Tax=Cetobacterium sp. TaxID=2071632 RepID=UPI003F3EF108
MGPEVLSKLLKNLPSVEDKNLIVGFDKSDDAAVYKITDDIALIQTLDFFTPMTEDPYIFGQIAAANSLSDVYAMGGEPKTAMNIVCFPEKENIEILGEILKGGAEKIAESGAILSGGHSIHDPEVKYGLSVTGLVHPDKILKNYGSKEGEVLIITKPLGTGIISTASKVETIPEEAKKEWLQIMTTLNKYSAEIIRDYSVSACTDITGFGFLGHAYEMAVASEKTFVLEQELIPYIEIAKDFAKEFYINSMGQKNRNYLNDKVDISSVPFWLQEILLDPQTSGGLLFSLPSNEASEVMEKLNNLSIKSSLIGTVNKFNGKYIVVR